MTEDMQNSIVIGKIPATAKYGIKSEATLDHPELRYIPYNKFKEKLFQDFKEWLDEQA